MAPVQLTAVEVNVSTELDLVFKLAQVNAVHTMLPSLKMYALP